MSEDYRNGWKDRTQLDFFWLVNLKEHTVSPLRLGFQSPNLRMDSWNLNTMRFVLVIGHPNHQLRLRIWRLMRKVKLSQPNKNVLFEFHQLRGSKISAITMPRVLASLEKMARAIISHHSSLRLTGSAYIWNTYPIHAQTLQQFMIALWHEEVWSLGVCPIGSMYGIFTYIYHKKQLNVGKYTIHGSYGSWQDHWISQIYDRLPPPHCASVVHCHHHCLFQNYEAKITASYGGVS